VSTKVPSPLRSGRAAMSWPPEPSAQVTALTVSTKRSRGALRHPTADRRPGWASLVQVTLQNGSRPAAACRS